MKIFLGSGSSSLGLQVCQSLGVKRGRVLISSFSNREKSVQLLESVDRTSVIILKCFSAHLHNDLFELLLVINAAQRASAKHITVVLPYYPYARQDHFHSGQALPPVLLSKILLQAGAQELCTIDLHAAHQIDSFGLPTTNLSTKPLLCDFLQQQDLSEAVLFAADGSMKQRVKKVAEFLGIPWGYAEKTRESSGNVHITHLQGNVKNKVVYLMDDRIDTGATLYAVAQHLKLKGAASIIGLVTHVVVNSKALRFPLSSVLNLLVTTNTYMNPPILNLSKKILSVAPLISQYLKTHG